MVEKKRKSKRVTTKRREQIRKNAAEHGRQKRRSARKAESSMKVIPDSVMKTDAEIQTLEGIRRSAEARQRLYENRPREEEEQCREVDDASRQYVRDIRKLTAECDVVLEVLDARDPMGSRSSNVERGVVESGKKIVLVLNKIDLVPREVWERWVDYLKRFFPCIPFKASTQAQRSNLGHSDKTERGAEAYGAKDLVGLLKNYARGGLSVTVGVFGCPNVGKSSLINSLRRGKACEVGAVPGITRSLQHVVIDSSIRLVDSPGVVFKNTNPVSNALRACSSAADPRKVVSVLVERVPRSELMVLYGIPEFAGEKGLLLNLALKWGKLRKGGHPDLDTAAQIVLKDLQMGKIKFYALPPAEDPHSDANNEFISALDPLAARHAALGGDGGAPAEFEMYVSSRRKQAGIGVLRGARGLLPVPE